MLNTSINLFKHHLKEIYDSKIEFSLYPLVIHKY